jgi:hypothetical protein
MYIQVHLCKSEYIQAKTIFILEIQNKTEFRESQNVLKASNIEGKQKKTQQNSSSVSSTTLLYYNLYLQLRVSKMIADAQFSYNLSLDF